MKKIINVNGMMCESCEKRVRNALSALEGVSACSASAEKNEVTLEYDEHQLTLDDIKETIEEIGYEAA